MTFNSPEARKRLFQPQPVRRKDYITETTSHAQTTLVLGCIKRENDMLDHPHKSKSIKIKRSPKGMSLKNSRRDKRSRAIRVIPGYLEDKHIHRASCMNLWRILKCQRFISMTYKTEIALPPVKGMNTFRLSCVIEDIEHSTNFSIRILTSVIVAFSQFIISIEILIIVCDF